MESDGRGSRGQTSKVSHQGLLCESKVSILGLADTQMYSRDRRILARRKRVEQRRTALRTGGQEGEGQTLLVTQQAVLPEQLLTLATRP